MKAEGLHEEDLDFGRDDLGEGIPVALDGEEGESPHFPREDRLGDAVGHAAEGTDGDAGAVGVGNLGDAGAYGENGVAEFSQPGVEVTL